MRGTGLNKLRVYRKCKQSILTEPYVESEHGVIRCELYPHIRQTLFHAAFHINQDPDFNHFNDTGKLSFILSNEKMILKTALPYCNHS